MFGLVALVVIVAAVLIGTLVGGRYRVAPPVLLILLGIPVGLLPRFGDVQLDPEVVLILFLPAILYWESLTTSLREIRANLRVITLNAVGLVLATAVTVSSTAQAFGIDPRSAWVLGAVLAPTDAAAMAGLAKDLPRRMLTILRTESLVNDGTALVLFGVTVAIATGDSAPGAPLLIGEFLGAYAGGITAGLLVGAVVVLVRRRLDAPLVEGGLSVATPYAAFLLSQSVHASGVVAVVASGLVLAHASPRVIGARARLQTFDFWGLATFLLNGGLFVYVGIRAPGAVRGVSHAGSGFGHAAVVALAVTGVVIATRIVWVQAVTVVIRTVDRRPVQRSRRAPWRQRALTSWAGFRGAVSLAAVLAVPAVRHDGSPFPDRDLLVFVTTAVILVTVLLQGITLPVVMRWARLPHDDDRDRERHLARVESAHAALAALPGAAKRVGLDGDVLTRLREGYERHLAVVEAEGDHDTDADGRADPVATHELVTRVELEVLAHKRQAVTELRDADRIDDIVLRELQATLDIEEVRLRGPVPDE